MWGSEKTGISQEADRKIKEKEIEGRDRGEERT